MQLTPHLSPRNIRAGTAILLVSVLALSTACGLSAAAPAAMPIATTTANSAVTLAAASPTATAIPSTPTPAPTATPAVAVPTPTIAATAVAPAAAPTASPATDGRDQYLADLRNISERWATWSEAASALMGEVGQDPLAICITRSGDIEAQVAGGRELLAALTACSPPAEIAAEHNRLVSEGTAGLNALSAGKEALCRRLDAGTALAKMEEVNAHLTEAYAAAGALFTWAQESADS